MNKTNKISLRRLKCVTACCTGYSLVHTSLLVSVLCSESLVWFEASGFCYTINTGTSLRLLSDISLFPYVMKIMHFWICRTCPFILYKFINGVGVGMNHLKILYLGLGAI